MPDEKTFPQKVHAKYVLEKGPSCSDSDCTHPHCLIVSLLRREAYPRDDANTARDTAGSRSPGLSQPAPRFVAVELLRRRRRARGLPVNESYRWVIIEVPVTYITKTAVMSYACTRAIVTIDNEAEWDLGSTVWVRNGTVLIPEQELKLPA